MEVAKFSNKSDLSGALNLLMTPNLSMQMDLLCLAMFPHKPGGDIDQQQKRNNTVGSVQGCIAPFYLCRRMVSVIYTEWFMSLISRFSSMYRLVSVWWAVGETANN